MADSPPADEQAAALDPVIDGPTDDQQDTDGPTTAELDPDIQMALFAEVTRRNEEAVADKLKSYKNEVDASEFKGLRDVGFVDDTGRNLPPFHVYLRMNDVCCSSPDKEHAEKLARPLRTSLEHQVSGFASDFDYGFVKISHYATSMGVYNSTIGETRINIKDLADFTVVEVTGADNVLEILRKYQKDAKKAPETATVMTFSAPQVDHNMNWMAGKCLSKSPITAKTAKAQVNAMKGVLSQASAENPIHFELVVLPVDSNAPAKIKINIETKFKAKLETFSNAVRQIHDWDTTHDPYDYFFAVDQQCAKQRTLPVTFMPHISGEDGRDISIQPQHTRFVNADQQLIFLAVGAAEDYRAQEYRFNEVNEKEFKIAVIPCPHVSDESRCMAIVMPEGNRSLLPQNGEVCRMKLETRPSSKPKTATEAELLAFVEKLVTVLHRASGTDDQIGVVRDGFVSERLPGIELTDDEINTYLLRDGEEIEDHTYRVHEFIEARADFLQIIGGAASATEVDDHASDEEADGSAWNQPAGGDPDSEPQLWCAATRLDIHGLQLKSDWQTYMVHKSKSMRENNEDFVFVEHQPGEAWSDYLIKITSDDHVQAAKIQRVVSDKALRRMVHAINSLKYPRSAPTPIASTSLDAYQYLVRFDPNGKQEVNLFDKFPEFRRIVDKEAPDWLLKEIDDMDVWKKQAFYKLNKIPASVKFIPGVAACGKSTFLRNIILCLFYGHQQPRATQPEATQPDETQPDETQPDETQPDETQTEATQPDEAQPDEAQPDEAQPDEPQPDEAQPDEVQPGAARSDEPSVRNRKVLYCVNNNAAVDTFATNLQTKISKLPEENAPDIVRLYSMESEVAQAMLMGRAPKENPFDRDAAQKDLDNTEDQNPQFSETDLFLSHYVIIRAELSLHAAKDKTRQKLSACRNMSLQESAVHYHLEHPERQPELAEILNGVGDNAELSKEKMGKLKEQIKLVIHEFLFQFRGVVCTTPIAAANFDFFTHFDADLILLDEAGRLMELELMPLLAWYRGPWILVGDVQQLGPFTHTDPSIDNEVQSNNPFIKQLQYATLGRAVDAGVTDSYLSINHRALGNLAELPKQLIYRGLMTFPPKKPRFPDSVLHFQRYLKEIVPEIKENSSRVMVHFPGAWVRELGNSKYNLAHVKWVIAKVVQALDNENLTSTNGDPASILIMPYYRAQLQMYETMWHDLVGTEVDIQAAKRVKFATLDSSQGDEADLCIIDLVLTDHTGFTGDVSRQCLSLTRGRQAEIIIAGPGMHRGREDIPSQQKRVAVISRLHTILEQDGAVGKVNTCVFCESPLPSNDEYHLCPDSDLSYVKCLRCEKYKDYDQHNMKQCPHAFCRSCKQKGHRTSECEVVPPCSRCHEDGHSADTCLKPQLCKNCGNTGHFANECDFVCALCKSEEHKTLDCPGQTCDRCSGLGHHRSTCNVDISSKLTCKKCGEAGHIQKDCTVKLCRTCNDPGHISRECPQRPASAGICFKCQEPGHLARDCTKPAKCRHCGETSHASKQCPQAEKKCRLCGGAHIAKDCPVEGSGTWKKSKQTGPAADRPKFSKATLIDSILGKEEETGWNGSNNDNTGSTHSTHGENTSTAWGTGNSGNAPTHSTHGENTSTAWGTGNSGNAPTDSTYGEGPSTAWGTGNSGNAPTDSTYGEGPSTAWGTGNSGNAPTDSTYGEGPSTAWGTGNSGNAPTDSTYGENTSTAWGTGNTGFGGGASADQGDNKSPEPTSRPENWW